jgi:AcrR family transcriptional regulator
VENDEQAPIGRRERRRLEVRARVLEAAVGLFEERGYDATTVADICERADIAYGTFFNHFPEKRDVLRMLADRAVETVEEKLETLAKQDGTIEEHLVQLLEGAAQEYETDDHLHRDLLGKIHAIAYTESPEDKDRRYHSAFERYIAESVARGRVRDDVPVETLADVVASMVSSLSLSWVHFEDFPIRERSAAAAHFLAESLRSPRG